MTEFVAAVALAIPICALIALVADVLRGDWAPGPWLAYFAGVEVITLAVFAVLSYT